jgi:hypothetical protein
VLGVMMSLMLLKLVLLVLPVFGACGDERVLF